MNIIDQIQHQLKMNNINIIKYQVLDQTLKWFKNKSSIEVENKVSNKVLMQIWDPIEFQLQNQIRNYLT